MRGGADRSWRTALAEARARLAADGVPTAEVDARRMVERASGYDGSELVVHLGEPVPHRARAHLDTMVERRAVGAPLQYVLGRWAFRHLDLLVDRRVLIPRPETEQVVDVALTELRRLAPGRPTTVVDLGTGSGAIALSVAVEVVTARVWGSDVSPDALAVARANLAGIGRPAARVCLVEGDWFSALPGELRGAVDMVVANPPYVAADDHLPPEVADWEPSTALVAGPTGLEHLARIVGEAPRWLEPAGALVLELAPHQAETISSAARAAGFADVEVRPDLAGRHRVLLARR
ncbi:MAG TPA: peptide chain release factor N(5)-glutamine methyltransferase [Acidimicrobiales bacterium]|nr:peptide chain release factor N(5)-glutamine methyltransferase [Acidimicrobiales bacterium]